VRFALAPLVQHKAEVLRVIDEIGKALVLLGNVSRLRQDAFCLQQRAFLNLVHTQRVQRNGNLVRSAVLDGFVVGQSDPDAFRNLLGSQPQSGAPPLIREPFGYAAFAIPQRHGYGGQLNICFFCKYAGMLRHVLLCQLFNINIIHVLWPNAALLAGDKFAELPLAFYGKAETVLGQVQENLYEIPRSLRRTILHRAVQQQLFLWGQLVQAGINPRKLILGGIVHMAEIAEIIELHHIISIPLCAGCSKGTCIG